MKHKKGVQRINYVQKSKEYLVLMYYSWNNPFFKHFGSHPSLIQLTEFWYIDKFENKQLSRHWKV